MERSILYASQDLIGTTKRSLATSIPIEIPSRGRSPSSLYASPKSISRTLSRSPELIFEMSPVGVEPASQLSSFRPLSVSVSRWNDEVFSLAGKLSECMGDDRPPSPQLEPRIRQSQTSAQSTLDLPVSVGKLVGPEGSVKPDLIQAKTSPVIRTSAVHKVAGFHPEIPTSDFQSNSHLNSIPTPPPRTPLTPSNSNLGTALPWLLPGTQDGEDDELYLSQSPTFFDFKKFLLGRLDKRSSRTP
ncbi:hypothetical protein AAF712_006843 [Marasmius tenuissimus]|uniref:Uncharacterized protein n=1 Tax=Marasmius tenuissimus TaxID=585030 RepID=A0ABR2ZXW0_9AGAR|nr:hypothetical protein PM082_017697 [Marasmius tenuissimus]